MGPSQSSALSSATAPERRALLVAAVAAVVFVAGVFVPTLVPHAPGSWGETMRALYAPLCHQQPGRSLHIAGAPVAVCARCTGAYLGGALGLGLAAAGLARLRRRKLAWLAVATLPSVIDVGARTLGYAGVGSIARLVLAVPAGAIAGLLLADGIEDSVRMLEQRGDARGVRPIPKRKRRPAWSAATAGERNR